MQYRSSSSFGDRAECRSLDLAGEHSKLLAATGPFGPASGAALNTYHMPGRFPARLCGLTGHGRCFTSVARSGATPPKARLQQIE
jgi:hypothetical protein